MSSSIHNLNNVGVILGKSNKFEAPRGARQDASLMFSSELSEGASCHMKPRKVRADGRYSSIGDGLESSISNEAKGKIDRLLGEIKNLSDVEKFVLYLKLPTGETPSEDLRRTPTPYSKQGNRVEQSLAYIWIKSHLEEDNEICLPKQEVYDEYKQYCDNHSLVPLCNADFGKLMKTVFPSVKPRRLGQRGQSRYCYGGLRKKLDVEAPSLPEIEVSVPQEKGEKTEDNHLYIASCDLVLEWAVKLLEQNFSGMRELAEYLVSNLFVNSKSVSAFTVIAAMEEAGVQKVSSMFSNSTGGDRHRETQLQLQRKLHEREHVSRQKKKLQQMKEDNVTRQKQDRQTPLIMSPTAQQDLMSPRKIFEESEDAEMRTHTGRSSIQDGVRPQRHRSVSSTRKKRTKSFTPQEALDKGGGTSSGEEISTQSSQAVAVPKENQMIVEQGVVNSGMSVVTDSGTGSTVEMMTVEDLIHSEKWRGERWKMEDGTTEEMTEGALKLTDDRREKSVLVHAQTLEQTIPQLSSAGSAALSESKPLIVQAPSHHQPSEGSSLSSLLNSNPDLGVIPSVVIAAEDVPQNKDTTDSKSRFLSTASISVPINILPTLSSSTPTVSSSSSFAQLSYLQKEPQCITNTTVSNRSAFVPFSQFTRKDNSGDGPDLLLEPDDNPCLSEKAQTFLISENGKQIIIMTSKSNVLNLPSNVDPTDSQIQLVPGATASSNHPSAPVKTTTTPAQVEPQSPTTPKKNRSRFTPIRPKGSPAKTVSSILKEQKLPEKPDSEKIDRSKSVSTLLKEKREREAKLQISVSTAAVVPTPGVASMGGLATIPATKLPLQTTESPHGEYFIILNPVAPGLNTPMVSMTSESVTSVTTTLTTVSSHGAVPECSSSTADLYLRQERSRTASLSEGEITSPSNVDNLNMSDLSDSSDEKPSKLAKIVDSDQNVSSRPGSRCSVDRETPSILGRKRKLFSSQSVEGGNYIERHPTRVPSNDEDADFTMEEDRRAVSCSLERCSQRDVSRVFDDKLKLAEKRNYPDISVLESDALQDACIPDPSNFILKGKELIKQKQDTGVGVTSLSLRKSQQRLLKEKPILDERMKSFFQQNDSVLGGKTSEPPEDSELPPDVAEFITDSMTQAHLGEQMEISSTMHPTTTRSLSRQEVVQEICKNLQNIPCDPSVLPAAKSPVCPQRSHSAKNLPPSAGVRSGRMSLDEETFRMPYRSQSVTDASRALLDIRVPTPDKIPIQPSQSVKDGSHQTAKKTTGGVEFASPQRPIRRQRTPSTENPRKRESSVERSLSQTPHSDPGYGSVGPSPILQTVLVSTGTHVCDSTYSSMSSTSLSVCRPDSAHSVTSDGNIPSPMASPRFQTSTPYHLKSPCVTPSQAPVSSEALPVQSFMPIQGSSRKIDNSFVTLIRPVVTIASQISQNATAGQVFVNEAMDEAKAKSTKQAPPSYTAAMQDMERKSKKESKQGAFKTLEAPLLSLSDDSPLPGPPLNETMSGHSFYFSDKLAQLSKKTHTSDSETVQDKTSRRDQSIKIIMGQLTSPIDPLHQGQSNIQSLSELPDANYQGNQPNVNMFDIEGIVTYKNSLVTEVSGISESEEEKQQGFHEQGQFSARRNLSEILGQNFTGDDLQATLDDLKAVDSQYFVDNFDLGSEKRQEI